MLFVVLAAISQTPDEPPPAIPALPPSPPASPPSPPAPPTSPSPPFPPPMPPSIPMPKVPPLPPPVTVGIGFFVLTSTIISLVFPLLLCLTLCFVYGRPRGAAPSSKEARPPSSPGRARISSSDIRVDLRAPDKAAAAPKDNPFFPSAMEDAAAMDEVVIDSEWSGTTAGGCPNYATWTNNPTFVLARKAKTSRAP